jgi:hypothetical protein
MPRSVEVRFVVGGTSEVLRAFDSIDKRAERAEQGQRRAANDDVARTRKTANEKVREEERATREREKLLKRYEQQQIKLSEQSLKAIQKTADEKTRIEERWARASLDFVHKVSLAKQRQLEAEVREVERAERQKASARERWARATGSRIGGTVGGSVGNLASRAVGMAGMALTVGGGFGIADAVQSQFAAQRAAAQLVNAVTTSGTAPSGASVGNIMQQASGIAIRTGMAQSDVIGGMLAYSRSARGGDFGGVQQNAEFFAKMSKSTGTSITDLATAAGVLQSQNADLSKDPAAMRQLLLSAYAQTKSGSVSLVDAAKQFGTLGSTRGLFQGSEAHNQATLLGLGQIAAAGGSSEEIGTYIKDFSLEVAQKRRHTSKEIGLGGRGLESLGVHFDKTGRMESPEQAIGAIFKATGGDLGQIAGLVGKRGIPLFSELQKSFMGAGGGDAGVAAVNKQIHSVTQSTMSEGDLQSQFDQVMSTPAERLGKSFEELKEKVGEALMPELEKLANKLPEWIPKIEKAIESFGKMLDWLSEHPWEGLGLVIAASITKDLAAAAIGEAVKKTLVSLLSGGSGGGTGGAGGAPGSPANALAATAGIVGGLGSATDIYTAASNARDVHKRGGGLAKSAYRYLDDWQSGNFGWVGGASWNPLVTGAKMGLGALGDDGVQASDQGQAHVAAFQAARAKGGPMQGSSEHHAQKQTDLLQKIADNTSRGGSGMPSDGQRTHPLGASRGATQ